MTEEAVGGMLALWSEGWGGCGSEEFEGVIVGYEGGKREWRGSVDDTMAR